jgi:MFS transporter, MHS family, proline/betaine transporter
MSEQKQNPKKIILASAIGGAVEFYDFTLYGALAFAFAPLFFPSEESFVSVLSAYAVFGVGFFARPLGSIIFGHVGDNFGRRTALFWSLILMSIATLAMGLLPTYQAIGVGAPILMVLARLLQGLSAGGEYSGALIFGIEHGLKKRSGLIGSTIAAGCMSGLLLGSLASVLCGLAKNPSVSIWRIPFLIGFLISLVGIYIRFRLEETPVFIAQKKVGLKPVALFQEIKRNLKPFLSVIVLSGFNGIALYVYFVFLPSYIAKEASLAADTVKLYSAMGTAILMFSLVFFGWISDKVNRVYLIMQGAALTTLTALLLFYNLPHLSLFSIGLYLAVFVIAFAMYSGPLNTFIIETFPVGVRYRCASLGYSLGMGIIGGSAPLIAGLLSLNSHKTLLLSLYFIISGVLAFFALCQTRTQPYAAQVNAN